jgi:acetylornithine deacetylase
VLDALRRADPEFRADATVTAYRPAYSLDAQHALPVAIGDALRSAGLDATPTGMSFWTDAAILAAAGIPSVLFGPGGAGLHSREEYVLVDDLRTCRDVLVSATRVLVGE